jgi:hypothetical protein
MGAPTPPGPVPPPPSPRISIDWGAPDARRTLTYRAVDQIRTGITIYLIVPLLSLITVLIATAAILATNSYVVGNYGGSGLGGLVRSNSAAVTISGELFGFVGLILTIVAWVTWRRGVQSLAPAAGEYAPQQVPAARQAEKDYDYTVYTFIAALVFGIAVAVLLVLLILSAVTSNINSGQSSSTAVANALAASFGVLVVVGIVSVVLTVLLYHFATRSLVGSIAAIAAPATKARLQRARSIILVGAVLGILAEGALVTRYLYPLALLGPLTLLIGFFLMRAAYSEWLAAPSPPTGSAAAPTGFAPTVAFPPPPPRA